MDTALNLGVLYKVGIYGWLSDYQLMKEDCATWSCQSLQENTKIKV